MSKGITKKQKRQRSAGHSVIARMIRVIHGFFPDYNELLDREIKDPRNQAYITYPQKDLINEDILRDMTGVVSMRAINDAFNSENAIRNLGMLSDDSDISEMPDWQTMNNDFERIDPSGVERVLPDLIERLIKTRQFEKYRVQKCYPVILDGTGIAYFKEKHSEHDLVAVCHDKDGNEVRQYYNKVVAAKIIIAPKLVLTLGVEFIENEKEDVDKQDCENRAAKRLMARIHKRFSRLPILLLGDGLYGVGSIIKQCIGYHWHYLLNLKDGVQKAVCTDFQDFIDSTGSAVVCNDIMGREHGKATFMNGVEKVSDKEFPCNCIRYEYTNKDGGKETPMRFQWITDLDVTKGNAEDLVKTGRKRWKIENEGFNVQKNGIYEIEHLCSLNYNAMKIHFLLTQIADIFMQLFLMYDEVVNYCRQGLKDAARWLLLSLSANDAALEETYINKKTAFHKKNIC